MTDRDWIVTEDELNAYVDDELPADRRSAVEAWLATHPHDAARVAAWRRQGDLIRERYGHLASEAPPARLSVERLVRRRYRPVLSAVAASLAAFLIGGAAGWTAHSIHSERPSELTRFASDAMVAYRLYAVEVRHPGGVTGGQRPHLVAWLAKGGGPAGRTPGLC